MKVKITEALRLKNEISSLVNNTFGEAISHGSTFEDDVHINVTYDTFNVHINKVKRIFELSEHINDVLSTYNVNSGLSNIVRKLKNIEVLILKYNRAIDESTPTTSHRFVNVGNDRKLVTVRYEPTHTKKELKAELHALKLQERELRSKLDELNSSDIELNFEYSDLDMDIETIEE